MKKLDEILRNYDQKEIRERAEADGVTLEQAKTAIERDKARNEWREKILDSISDAHDRIISRKNRQLRDELGALLGLNVPCSAAHITVLGGLTERSSGSGMNSNTVQHILLHRKLESGRLRRLAGDLLCKPMSRMTASFRVSIYDLVDHCDNEDDLERYIKRINCKTCVARLESIKKQWQGKSDLARYESGDRR